METKINSREVAQIKRICQNVDGDFQKVNKLKAKIATLQAEVDELQIGIDEMEAPVVRKTGYKSTDLVEKVVSPMYNPDGTPKTDKNGVHMKVTKYVLKYPETIVPPTVETAGSDFDADAAIATPAEAEPVNTEEPVVEEKVETVDNFDFTRFNN